MERRGRKEEEKEGNGLKNPGGGGGRGGGKKTTRPGFNRAGSERAATGNRPRAIPTIAVRETQDATRPQAACPAQTGAFNAHERSKGRQNKTRRKQEEKEPAKPARPPARAKRAAEPNPWLQRPSSPTSAGRRRPWTPWGDPPRGWGGGDSAKARRRPRLSRVNRRPTAPSAPSGYRPRRNARRLEAAEPPERNRMGRRIGRSRKP